MSANPLATAARSFERTLKELGLSGKDLGDPAELGRRAALLAATEAAWEKHIGRLLERSEAQTLLGVRTRQAVSELVRRKRLLAVRGQGGRLLFPTFQFARSGRPFPEMPDILTIFEPAHLDPYTIAGWFTTGQGLLEGMTPADWLRQSRDPGPVLESARGASARLSE